MNFAALLISLTPLLQSTDKVSIQFIDHQFQISFKKSQELVSPIETGSPVPPFIAFRKNDAFAVWDDRGLTVRRGKNASSSRLPEIAVSPHAFKREEILKTIRRIRSGELSKNASALSGAKRLGKNVYFLLRWEDKALKPWAEALVQVDLTSDNPEPKLLGRFDGLTMATKSIDDKLQILHGRLCIVEHQSDSWGLSTFDPETLRFTTQQMGGKLLWFEPINTTQGLFVETTSYGTQIAGRVDLETGTRKIFYEGRERLKFLDKATPTIVIALSEGKSKLINCLSSSVATYPTEIHGKRTSNSVLIWSPQEEPAIAWLVDPKSFTTLTTWHSKR